MRDTHTSNFDSRNPTTSTNSNTTLDIPTAWHPGAFDFEKLDVFAVAREALARGDKVARRLPRGYATLADQLRRALLSTYLGIAEASSRAGNDRLARYKCSRGEAAEAGAALQAVAALGLVPAADVEPIITLLRRTAAMLTRLAQMAR